MTSKDSLKEFQKKSVQLNTSSALSDAFASFVDWYYTAGRALYVHAFKHETNMDCGRVRKLQSVIEQAYPKNVNELEKRTKWNDYYKSNAYLFIQEVDFITEPFRNFSPIQIGELPELQTKNNLAILKPILHDGIQLIEDWAHFVEGVPGVYGVGKNMIDPTLHYYHSALQTIYGTPSSFAFMDNHSDTSIVTLRAAIELRLRRAFGVLGKEKMADGSFEPLNLSILLSQIDDTDDRVLFAIPMHIISRIYSWANIYTHTGLRGYRWAPISALKYLRPFLLGTDRPANGSYSVHSGLIATEGFVNEVQNKVSRIAVSQSTHRLFSVPPSQCDVVLMKKNDIAAERAARAL